MVQVPISRTERELVTISIIYYSYWGIGVHGCGVRITVAPFSEAIDNKGNDFQSDLWSGFTGIHGDLAVISQPTYTPPLSLYPDIGI